MAATEWELWEIILVVLLGIFIGLLLAISHYRDKEKQREKEEEKCKWQSPKEKIEEQERDANDRLYWLLNWKYGGTTKNAEQIQTSRLAKKCPEENRLIKLSLVDHGKHTHDFAVYKDKTIKVASDQLLSFNGVKNLTDKEYDKIIEWEKALQKEDIHCCPDGEPGIYQYVTVEGKEPMNFYGSTMVNKPSKAAFAFKDFCFNIMKEPKENDSDSDGDFGANWGFPTKGY